MEYRDMGPPGRTHRPEPSWPTVIATTLRLWLERHPIVVGGKTIRLWPLNRRKIFAALTLAAGLVLAGAGAAGLVTARHPAVPQWNPAAAPIPAPVGPIAAVARPQSAGVPLPVALTIPAIGVQTKLVDLGVTNCRHAAGAGIDGGRRLVHRRSATRRRRAGGHRRAYRLSCRSRDLFPSIATAPW